MNSFLIRANRLAILRLLLILTVALSAYGHAYADSHPASATAGPPSGIAELDIEVDNDTLWKEVFDQLTTTEQSCIREALDEELLDSFLDRPVLAESDTEQLDASIFSCLAPDTARAILLSILIAGIEGGEFGAEVVLSEEEASCLREWASGIDVAAWITATEADDFTAVGELIAGVFSCVPDLFLSLMLADMGTDLDELSEDEASCLREWMADVDITAWIATDFTGAEELVVGVFFCVPDLFLSLMLADMGTDLDELSEDEAACLREWASGIDWAALLVDVESEDLSEAWELVLGIFACVPDLLLSAVTEDDAESSDEDAAGEAADVADDHGDRIEDATSTIVGEVIQGAIDYDGDTDFFVFEAENGEIYQVDVELETLSDSIVTLYDADEWWLASNDDYQESGASRIVWRATSAGAHYVEVWGYGTGSYNLTVAVSDIVDDHANSGQDATTATVAEIVQGAIDYEEDSDFFVFEAEEGEIYQIDVEPGTLSDLRVTLYDVDEWGLVDDYRQESEASRIVWKAASSGEYYVEVGGYGTGSFTLTVAVADVADDHADSGEDATSATTGEPVNGVVDYYGDTDFFVFEAEEGEIYQIDVEPGTLYDLMVTLYDADEWPLAVDYDHRNIPGSRVYWEAPSPGEYYVEVGGYDIGSYTLTIQITEPSPATDRAALEALYDATGGEDWSNNANWLTKAPLGAWYGVTTDLNGNVTLLYLADNWLSGEIPPELGDLSSLVVLDLSDNRLSGEIPPELGDLSNLVVLVLRNNQLTGCVPSSLEDQLLLVEFALGGIGYCGGETSGETSAGASSR